MKWKYTLFLAFCSSFIVDVSADNLFVFVPTDVRAKSMEQDISAICPKVDVTVFGRGKDFRKLVKKSSPNAILSLLPVIETTGRYETVMRGMQKGYSEEEYVLVSVEKPMAVSEISGKKIGVVDLLGRKPMAEFVNQLFLPTASEGGANIKVKRVTKQEDLLPLLTFGSVDGIFVSDRLFRQIKQKSNVNLVATSLNIKIGLVSAALAPAATKKNIVDCLTKFSEKLNGTLGVDKWQIL